MRIRHLDPGELVGLGLPVTAVERYAIAQGWQLVTHPKRGIPVLEGPLDDEGEPIIAVLPPDKGYSEELTLLRLAEVITTLAAFEEKSPKETLSAILASQKDWNPEVFGDCVSQTESDGSQISLNSQGALPSRSGKNEEALASFNRALEIEPDNLRALE